MQVSASSLFNTDGTPVTTTSTSTATEDGSSLDKADFFQLLCTQLKYQDPLNPSTDTDMASQLAQFSSLESMQSIESAIKEQTESFNTAVTTLKLSALSTTNSSSVNLIGKTVRLQKTSAEYDGLGGATELRVNLGDNESATVTILDEEGETVRTISTGEKDSDDTALASWDGRDGEGNLCDSGTYTISIEGSDGDSSLYCFIEGTVSGVRFTADGPAVVIDGEELAVSDIIAVD